MNMFFFNSDIVNLPLRATGGRGRKPNLVSA